MAPTRFAVAALALSVAAPAAAQNLRVLTVPWVAADPAIPHLAYNGRATTFKAIARGGNGVYQYEWDFQGDGVYDFSAATTNRYNLSTRFTLPNQAQDTTFVARVRVTSNGQTVVGSYPVRVLADVPANPSFATDAQLQVMRNVAIDDGLWYLHNQMTRSGNEEDPLFGAQLQGLVGGAYPTLSTAGFLEVLGMNGHFPAFPAAYLGAMPDPAANDARWQSDPYAEDAARLVNGLLTRATIVAVAAADEANLVGFYPEVTATPIAGTDDGIGIWIGYAAGDLTTGPHSTALRALARANLAGHVAQVGDPTRILGRPFEFLVQQMVDALVWAQNDSGSYPGSWYYTPNAGADMLGEFAGGVLDAEEALLVAERAMGAKGVLVPNLAKARLSSYIQASQNNCATGGIGGSYMASSTVCDFALSAANLVAWGWVGANLRSTADSRLAFPSYNGLTMGQLRSFFDGTVTFITNTFLDTAIGMNAWDIGFVPARDFSRTDGSGDLWSMLHWTRAARAVQPEIVRFGPHDHARLFSGYLVRNQAADGGWNWVLSSMNNYNDQIVGPETRASWAIATLSAETGVVPVARASSSASTAPEGTPISFAGEGHAADATYVWSFGNGESREGRQVVYAYPDDGAYSVLLTVTTPAGSSATVLPVAIQNAAPVVDAGPGLFIDEGGVAAFAGSFTDPGAADTHTLLWDLGGGQTATTLATTRAFPQDGVYAATLTVTDDDGAVGSDTVPVTVRNVPPLVTSTPPASAAEGSPFAYTLAFTDPGAGDVHTCSAPVKPSGATLTGCTLEWVPALGQLGAPAPITLCVADDGGGTTCQPFDLAVIAVDSDADGLPDSWELRFFGGLSQTGAGDFDLDGLTNAEELALGSDPARWDGPAIPVVLAPSCGSRLATDRPTLVVANALDPLGTAGSYQFEVYDPAAPGTPVATSGDVPAGPGYTAWDVDVPLQEDQAYVWRARAGDGVIFGGWTGLSCPFVVDVVGGQRMLSVTDDLVGSACDAFGNGGQRTLGGFDDGAGGGTAGDGVLQPGEVRSTTIVCNGRDGPSGSGGGCGTAPGGTAAWPAWLLLAAWLRRRRTTYMAVPARIDPDLSRSP